MWIKTVGILLLFLILAVLQTTFLPHISIGGAVFNVVFVVFFTLAFFEKESTVSWQHLPVQGLVVAAVVGCILDAFSTHYFGPSIISLMTAYVAIKLLIHFLKERQSSYLFIYFILIFLVVFIGYGVLMDVLVQFPHVHITMGVNKLVETGYNLLAAAMAYYVGQYIYFKQKSDRQLKLFR